MWILNSSWRCDLKVFNFVNCMTFNFINPCLLRMHRTFINNIIALDIDIKYIFWLCNLVYIIFFTNTLKRRETFSYALLVFNFSFFAFSHIWIVGTKCVIEKFLEVPDKRDFTQHMGLYSEGMPHWGVIQELPNFVYGRWQRSHDYHTHCCPAWQGQAWAMRCFIFCGLCVAVRLDKPFKNLSTLQY